MSINKDEFMQYENCRLDGDYNMFDPRARQSTDLDKHKWLYIMSNYADLAKKYL